MSDVLSIIALIISVLVAIIGWIRDGRLSRMTLEAEYFKDIYKKHMIYDIPVARKYIRFNAQGKLLDTDKLIKELQTLNQDSLYFQYNNNEYYEKLKNVIQDLENYLVTNTEKNFTGEEQVNVLSNIKRMMDRIYKVISDGYLGKSRYRLPKIKVTVEK